MKSAFIKKNFLPALLTLTLAVTMCLGTSAFVFADEDWSDYAEDCKTKRFAITPMPSDPDFDAYWAQLIFTVDQTDPDDRVLTHIYCHSAYGQKAQDNGNFSSEALGRILQKWIGKSITDPSEAADPVDIYDITPDTYTCATMSGNAILAQLQNYDGEYWDSVSPDVTASYDSYSKDCVFLERAAIDLTAVQNIKDETSVSSNEYQEIPYECTTENDEEIVIHFNFPDGNDLQSISQVRVGYTAIPNRGSNATTFNEMFTIDTEGSNLIINKTHEKFKYNTTDLKIQMTWGKGEIETVPVEVSSGKGDSKHTYLVYEYDGTKYYVENGTYYVLNGKNYEEVTLDDETIVNLTQVFEDKEITYSGTVLVPYLHKVNVELPAKSAVYTGKNIAMSGAVVTAVSSGREVTGSDITYKYYSDEDCTKAATPKNAGTYYVVAETAEATDLYTDEFNYTYYGYFAAQSAPAKLTITKAAATVKAKTTSKTYTKSALKKAAKSFSIGASVTGNGKITCKKTSGSSKLTVSKAGKVTVKKGTSKGSYTAKIKISAAASTNYKAKTKTVTVKVKVK